jgi:ABC-2 type transport system permease protein
VGNLDSGLILGSYFGLLFLVACYTAIGLFASTLTGNQAVAFISSLVMCFVLYYGFEAVATILTEGTNVVRIQAIGMKWHFERLAAGILDTRDLIYFSSLTFLFIYLTVWQIKHPGS